MNLNAFLDVGNPLAILAFGAGGLLVVALLVGGIIYGIVKICKTSYTRKSWNDEYDKRETNMAGMMPKTEADMMGNSSKMEEGEKE